LVSIDYHKVDDAEKLCRMFAAARAAIAKAKGKA
jgi:hypothetical protein